MSNQKPGMLVPALIGGGIAGLFSAIPFLNCLCCLWIIAGAMLAAYLLAKDYPTSLPMGDGAIVGVLTGIVAAVVDAIISLPLQAVNAQVIQRFMERLSEYTSEMPPGWENWMERGFGPASAAMFLVSLLMSAVIFALLGALGGILGAALLGKKPAAGQINGPSSENPGHS
ncbi:MAG: hypothetical protein J7L26_08040 [Candidatus Aminicenantes bacterium]|nr:hypothetical protein [Candidatus Aminicenantes bacterium]